MLKLLLPKDRLLLDLIGRIWHQQKVNKIKAKSYCFLYPILLEWELFSVTLVKEHSIRSFIFIKFLVIWLFIFVSKFKYKQFKNKSPVICNDAFIQFNLSD